MSHNKIKVGGQTPSITGEISVSLDNLADVSTSGVSTGEVLKKTATGWESGAVPSAGAQHLLIGQGGSDDYSNSSANASSPQANQFIELYDTAPINTITGASITSASGWVSAITLPAGDYFIQSTVQPGFSASGYFMFSLARTSDNVSFSNSALVGDNAAAWASGVASAITGWLSVSTSTTLSLRCFQAQNVENKASQGTVLSENSSILIVKL